MNGKSSALLLIGGGTSLLAAFFFRKEIAHGTVVFTDKVLDSIIPTTTGWRGVDKILPQLQRAAQETGIPLGLMVGWVGRESAGRLNETPKPLPGQTEPERGYFQLHPDESKSLGLDHQRLSTDSDYSIYGGTQLIQKKYMPKATQLAIAPFGTVYYWKLVKALHGMGTGAISKIVEGAKAAGATGSWEALENHALANDAHYTSLIKHSPAKWLPHVDSVYEKGKAFGFGTDSGTARTAVAGTVFGGEDVKSEVASRLVNEYYRSVARRM